ncbi:MAG: hypothetical protein AAF456_04050, partial [Planctomycetota bacterium]
MNDVPTNSRIQPSDNPIFATRFNGDTHASGQLGGRGRMSVTGDTSLASVNAEINARSMDTGHMMDSGQEAPDSIAFLAVEAMLSITVFTVIFGFVSWGL